MANFFLHQINVMLLSEEQHKALFPWDNCSNLGQMGLFFFSQI